MRAMSFEDWFEKEINEQIASRKDALVSGAAISNYEQYQNIVGVVSGLTLALNTFKSLAKKQMEYEDE